jgi:phenylacetate-CoA ligase
MVPVDVIKLSDEVIEELVQEMESKKNRYNIIGYVSALEQICKYLERKGVERVDAEVASIITMSESLTEYVKEKMEEFFGVPVYARYSNLENGILAQQVPGSDGKYLINQASYKIEVLNFDNDQPAPPGVPGRVVVTDLFNYAMPMIRYDTGDIGTQSGSDLKGNACFEKIEGRKLDILYDTTGNIVSSYIMYKNMWQYTEIKQYQLIQEGEKKYRFKINLDTEFTKEEKLVEEFKQYLGSDADFAVEYVDEIPLLASGKRKKTLNTWKK